MKLQNLLFATLVMFSFNLKGQNLNYPELEVVPSAEDRLKNASEQEGGSYFQNHWQIILPASAILLKGIVLSNDIDLDLGNSSYTDAEISDKEDKIKQTAQIATIVGAAWLGLSYYLHKKDSYSISYQNISKLPNKTMADKLARARYAEEALLSRSKIMGKLKYLLAGSTLIFSLAEIKDAGNKATSISALGVLASGIPLMFDHFWQSSYENYETGKKRIFGPVVSANAFKASNTGAWMPGLQLSYNF